MRNSCLLYQFYAKRHRLLPLCRFIYIISIERTQVFIVFSEFLFD